MKVFNYKAENCIINIKESKKNKYLFLNLFDFNSF
jgi:hypothetical protein